MLGKPSHKRVARGIYKRTSASGQVYYLTYDGTDSSGKPMWKKHDTREAAEEHRNQLRIAKLNEGRKTWALTPDQREDAARATELLAPYPAAKVVHAAQYYIDHVLKVQDSKTVTEAVAALLAATEQAGRRPKSIRSLRNRLDKFAERFGNRKLQAITVDELQKFIDRQGKAPRTKIHFATNVSQLFNFAKKRGWVSDNMAQRIVRPSIEDGEIESFGVQEAAALLNHASKFGLLPYIAIGLFAGVRREEQRRLDWSKVSIAERTIIIGKEVAKKRSRRVIEINDTLLAWLTPCAQPNGKIIEGSESQLNDSLRSLAKAAEVKWVQNGLRHSYASYFLAKWQDITRLAYQMGEKDPAVIYNHYAGLRTPAEAEKYWGLRPGNVDGVLKAS
jgi:integrase